ncbi:MAG: MotE family protein [Paracoccaceae bacterium]
MSFYRTTIALPVLASGFVLSALLRTGDVVAALPDDGFGNPLTAPTRAEFQQVAPSPLIAELKSRRASLDAQEKALAERAQELEALEDFIRRRLDQLDTAREELEQNAALVDGAAIRDVRHLTDMYSSMKPKQAALIFDQMPPSFAAGFLAKMDPNVAALIMANMSSDRAYAVSLLIAGRHQKSSSPE